MTDTPALPSLPETGAILEALPLLLTVVRRLCTALAYLHGEGIVHRDLKPENVLIRSADPLAPDASADLLPVIVDFGLVSQFSGEEGREILQEAGSLSGTLAYMAPEQARGEHVDARADLYSLGCILYRLLTGRPPFVRPTAKELLQAHLSAEPVPPSAWVEGLPRPLDQLILHLLEKRPEARIGHAATVAAALVELGADPADPLGVPTARAYLYRPRFTGRKKLLETLEASLWRLDAGAGGILLLGGESGVGKTRLAMELARLAAIRGIAVLLGQCQPAGLGDAGPSGHPLQPLRPPLQALADRCHELGAAETQRLLGPRGPLLGLYEPALLDLPGQRGLPLPAPLPPQAARERLFEALSETFRALADARPTLLVLDDLQWADELTLGFLEYLLRPEASPPACSPFLVLGTYRSEESGQLERLLIAHGGVLSLPRFGATEVGAMVRTMLALSPTPDVFVEHLTRHSEGNPFFVAEYLRTAVAAGVLYRDRSGRWLVAEAGDAGEGVGFYEALPLPGSLRALVGRRLDALSAGALELAKLAAILGREAEEAHLSELAARHAVPELDSVRELLARQVLEAAGPVVGGQRAGLLRFVHDKIREEAYARIEPEARPRLHRDAAELLEALGPRRAEHLAALAQHWDQAGEPGPARLAYQSAAEQAVSRSAFAEAERLYRAYLRLVAAPDEMGVQVLNDFGYTVLHRQGRNAEAGELFQQALAQARALDLPHLAARSASNWGIIEWLTGHVSRACELFTEALTGHRIPGGGRNSECLTLHLLATAKMQLGLFPEAESLYREALDLARELKNPGTEGLVLCNLAILCQLQGRWSEARSHYEVSLGLFQALGDRGRVAGVLGNIGALALQQGRLEQAEEALLQAGAIQRELVDRRNEAYSIYALADVYISQGRFDEAEPHYERALAFARRVKEPRAIAMNLRGLAKIALHRGQLVQARTLLREALAQIEGTESPMEEANVLTDLAGLQRQVDGDLAQAARSVDRAEALLIALNNPYSLSMLWTERGLLELAAERSAERELEQAREVARRLEVGSEGLLGRALVVLERAQQDFVGGRPLFRGERLEDLPEGLRRALEQGGPLASPVD